LINFTPHPEIAVNDSSYDPKIHKAIYRYDYEAIFKQIAEGKVDKRGTYRSLILNDLFFVVLFVLEIEKANHPFVVQRCANVQDGPVTDTLDVWARFHWKSTIITIAETIQYALKNPEHCNGIHCYVRPLAKKFLDSIKQTFEKSELLKWCFPDVVWQKPEVEAPNWSLDGGITLKRKSASRKEATVEAWGLVEGQATGRHFERNVLDDIETDDIRESPEQLSKCYSKIEMSENLGTGSDNDVWRLLGTFYSHFGPMVKLTNRAYPDGRKMYSVRIKTGSDNGQKDGNPVYMDLKTWEKMKMSQFFNSQQLCDPTPSTDVKLDHTLLKPVEPQFIPRDIYKFMVIDQAGEDDKNQKKGDLWSFGVVGIKPNINDIGASDVYLLDIDADQMTHAESIDGIVQMYLRNGMIMQLGVEKVGLATTEIHIANALRARGRRVSLDNKTLMLLRPAGRSKTYRIESALQWPLNNGCLHYSTDISLKYIDAIKEEMQKFPFYHVDILDMWAYAYDLFKEFHFVSYKDEEEYEDNVVSIETGRSAYGGY
jgi:hypothetical protein